MMHSLLIAGLEMQLVSWIVYACTKIIQIIVIIVTYISNELNEHNDKIYTLVMNIKHNMIFRILMQESTYPVVCNTLTALCR